MRNREAAGWAGQAWIGAGPVEGDVALPGPQLKLRVEPGRGRGLGEIAECRRRGESYHRLWLGEHLEFATAVQFEPGARDSTGTFLEQGAGHFF